MAKKKSGDSNVTVTENGDAVYTPQADSADGSGQKKTVKPRDKRESFLRLAERRVNDAIKRLERIIPLANGAAYDYHGEEGEAIVSALRKAVDDIARAFSGQKRERPTFSLRSPTPQNGQSYGAPEAIGELQDTYTP